jgi:hypothetical protein
MNNMKNNFRLLVVALGIIAVTPAIAQKDNVGIGTTKPDQSAVLDVSSSTKGLLMPRMSLQQRSSIQNPAQGLVVYQTDFLSGFYFYDGAEWKTMTSQNSVAGVDGDWVVGGNGTLPGAPTIARLAYDNNIPFEIRMVSNRGALLQTSNPNTSFGYAALNAVSSGQFNVAFGAFALSNTTTGSNNFGIGTSALESNTTGSGNMALGTAALISNTVGGNNTAIGNYAGQNVTGNSNIFLGYAAGQTAGNVQNKLYIANNNTTQPTIYGDLNANFISIGNNITLAKRDAIATAGTYGLLVEKGILTEKIKVATLTTTDWSDYVFESDYKRMSLEEVEQFVKENKHLPNVPTTVEMMASGSDLIKTDAKLLEKIEELTLYMIEMNKEIKALKAENAKLKK